MKVAHLIHDAVFFEQMYDRLESVSDVENHYLCIITPKYKNKKIKYLKEHKNYTVVLQGSDNYSMLLRTAYDYIFIHSLSKEKIDFLVNYESNAKYIWISWGGDYVNLINYKLFQERTKKYLWFYNPYYYLLTKYLYFLGKKKKIRKIMNRIKFCSTVVPTEFSLLKRICSFGAKQITFYTGSSLYNEERNIPELSNSGIWIGNSATWENNHFDVFYKLKQMNIIDRKIIVPISYGNMNKKSVDILIKTGRKYFNDIQFLTEHLPLDEYIKLQKIVSFALYNNNRQQAVGNILISLFNGIKVFLSKESPVYKYFRELGLIIFSFQDDLSIEALQYPLNSKEKDINRDILRHYYSKETFKYKTFELFDFLKNQL